MSDKQAEAKAIVEKAIADLIALGMDPDGAAALLVVQGAIRIEEPKKRAEMAEFVASTVSREEAPEYQMMIFGN